MEERNLVYGTRTENLIEITMVYANLAAKYSMLKDIDSNTWKQEFVRWANEFEEMHPEASFWEDNDYMDCIEDFAKQKIYEFADIEQKPFYFTFGNWAKYPYRNTYLVVYAVDTHDAIEKYRKRFPDIHEDTVNCAAWYRQEQWEKSECQKAWKDREPAEIIR